VFWTTEAEPNTSEKNSVQGELRGSPNEFRALRLYFRTESPVTSLRIDPLSRRGEMQIDSMILTDDAPPVPQATPVEDMKIADGFQVELLHSVDGSSMGSWVCMTPDPQGRLIVSDQYGGLYRVTPPATGVKEPVMIEPIPVAVGRAQGLLCAFDSLYVMTNSGEDAEVGLHRLRDTNGDDMYDAAEHLRQLHGGNEHGPHAIILSPDGKSLYVCAGNHTPPTEFAKSYVPKIWDEDQLLPRMPDAGGHAVGVMAPGGWIARVDPDGKTWDLIASGFRNEYDIAFNREGELFTYDADMEWDVGSPWYRPTRVNHVTQGAEFGWRNGTGKWPAYYPDSLGSVVDIGPGSPTGIAFGTGAKFPPKYQKALFICDWSYGVIYAVHMTPSGSTYAGEAERFISAAPLPVTDLIINPKDQAMYFTIGGRRTQSGLYRVTYSGAESTAPDRSQDSEGMALRQLRRHLETLQEPGATDVVKQAWPYLQHADRTIRFTARTAIELQPVDSWRASALGDFQSADARIEALLALARCGTPDDKLPLLSSLAKLPADQLTVEQKLAALRVLGLAFIRLGEPGADVAAAVSAELNKHYPSSDPYLNRELCRLLVYLNDSQVAGKTLELLRNAPTQEEQIHYVYCLRALKQHWTREQREEFFRWFVASATLRGGNSFSGFLKNIRQEAIDGLTADERESLKDVLALQPTGGEQLVEAANRPVVKAWTVDDLLSDVEAGLKGRNFDNGRRMFQVTACFKCHRFAGDGGIVGPELTAVARRYNARTLLESIIEPAKVISDQYQATTFVLTDGRTVTGRVVNLNGDRLMVLENMLEPNAMTSLYRDDIEDTLPSTTSMMPAGLINTLTNDEVLDLLAYLQSGGDSSSVMFNASAATSASTNASTTRPGTKPMLTATGHTVDSLELVKLRVTDESAILIDVREQSEWDAGHLAAARLVPLSSLNDPAVSAKLIAGLPKDKTIYVHCKSGGRVLICAQLLKDRGFDLRPLKAGYADLLKAGFEKAP
jgi:putative heme-binding domain-containing protein